MKSRHGVSFGFIFLSLMSCAGYGQSKVGGEIAVSGNVVVPRALQDIVPGRSIVVTLRDSATHAMLAQATIVEPDTSSPDTGGSPKKFLFDKPPCYGSPTGCPYAISMKIPSLKTRRCYVCVEVQDKLYRSTNGREGCNRILGYYTGQVRPTEGAARETDVRHAKAILIDAKHRAVVLKLDIR